MKGKRDTTYIIKRRVNPDSVKYLVCDEIFTAKGDTMLLVRDVPKSLLYTAERARELKVRVDMDAPIGGSPVGHMVFDSAAKYTRETTLMLDGQWLPIPEQPRMKSDAIRVGTATFDAPVRDEINLRTESPGGGSGSGLDYNQILDVAMFELFLGFAIYAILSIPSRMREMGIVR
jgi:hypothetical protein